MSTDEIEAALIAPVSKESVRVMVDASLTSCLAKIRSNPGKYYVYILARPCGTPFYVGMGRHRRIEAHRFSAARGEKSRKANILRKIQTGGESTIYSIDGWFDTHEEAAIRECAMIAAIGRLDMGTGSLANCTSGGDGAFGFSLETRGKISRNVKAKRSLPASRERTRLASTAMWNAPGFRERAIEAVSDKWKEPRHKAMRIAAMTAALADPVVKARLSTSSRSLWAKQEHKERISKATAKQWESQEFRQQMENVRKRWQSDPIKKINCSASISRSQKKRLADPAVRAAISQKMKDRWSDPAAREKMMASRAASIARKKSQQQSVP